MLSPNSNKFLDDILLYIKFSLDKEGIRKELEGHIIDKTDNYAKQGYNREKAEQLSISDMGDAKEIGVELNKQHNPIIGWLWVITNVMMILFALYNVLNIGAPVVYYLFRVNLVDEIPKSDIVYKIDIDKEVKIDDEVIRFTNVIYEKNGDMNILYEYYDTRLWGLGWGNGNMGNITDNFGNKYFSGTSASMGGFITKATRMVRNFPKDADALIITYDRYNRKYRIEIPLKAGEQNE